MNNDQLKNRLRAADPAANAQPLSESLVVQATLKGKKSPTSYRTARFSLAGAAAAVLAVGLTLPGALAPQPLFSLANAPQEQPSAMNSVGAAEDSATKMIWPGWIQYNYVAEGLSESPGRGVVYEVRKVGDPIEILNKLAALFGVTGQAKEDEWSSKEFPSYSIEGDNFQISAYWSGAGYWNFGRWNPQPACIEPAPKEGEDSAPDSRCLPPQPTPELIPSEAEITAQTIETFANFGITVTSDQLNIYRDEWGAYATVSNSFQGKPIPIDFYIGWGMDGEITYVSGASFEIVERGEFGTVSPEDAVARIKDGRWYGGVSSKYYLQYSPPITALRDSVTSGSEGLVGSDEMPAEESQPVDPEPVEPTIVDLKINKSEEVLVSVYDTSGNMWLVPGYLLFNDQGWFDSIVSLVEGVIQLPDPYTVMPIEEDLGN